MVWVGFLIQIYLLLFFVFVIHFLVYVFCDLTFWYVLNVRVSEVWTDLFSVPFLFV